MVPPQETILEKVKELFEIPIEAWEKVYEEVVETYGGRYVYGGVYKIKNTGEPRLLVAEFNKETLEPINWGIILYNYSADEKAVYLEFELTERTKINFNVHAQGVPIKIERYKPENLEFKGVIVGHIDFEFKSGSILIPKGALKRFYELVLEMLQ